MANRSLDLTQGIAYVVTDLHGEWHAYQRYRDHFLELREQGRADYLIFLGDLIHYDGDPEEDYSLNIVWDVIQLRGQLGSAVTMVLGNHEMPHIYGVTLSRGGVNMTPRFEHTLGEYRPAVIEFFKGVPFCVRTSGGVMLNHAGASSLAATAKASKMLLNFSHQNLLRIADRLIEETRAVELIAEMFGMDAEQYYEMVWQQLAVESPDDPRYLDLLRGIIVSNLAEWGILWDYFFTQNEAGRNKRTYNRILEEFLRQFSADFEPQRVLVSGHISTPDGVEVIAGQQLRLASWTHADPLEEAKYLLFDVSQPVRSAVDLLPNVHPMP